MRRLAAGTLPSFPAATAALREGEWRVAADATGGDEAPLRLEGLAGYAEVAPRLGESLRRGPSGGAGTLVVEVVVDTVWATFEAEEILHELRDFAVRLRACPFGYLFDLIRLFSDRPEFVLPDRADIGAATPCVDAYFRHLTDVGTRRGAALLDVPERRRHLFDDDRPIEADDLLQVPKGRITEAGVRGSIDSALRYLGGDRQIDRIDAEFARAQLWQWVHHETGVLDTGRIIGEELLSSWLDDVQAELVAANTGSALDSENIPTAAARLRALTLADPIPLTIDAEGYTANA